MFNKYRLTEILVKYKEDFILKTWPKEMYKLEAIKCFQVNFDINATDFASMLERAFALTGSLLLSANFFPLKMIIMFAKSEPNTVRGMFINLFDENNELVDRIQSFKLKSNSLLEKYGSNDMQHFQYENAILTYLWLRYPDTYYIYKYGEVQEVSNALESEFLFKKGSFLHNINNFMLFYNEICDELKKDDELIRMFHSRLTPDCYNDPEFRTLTMDIALYISKFFKPKEYDELGHRFWLLNVNPRITDLSCMMVGDVLEYHLENDDGNKRKIYQNFLDAKEGDMVIGYESFPINKIVSIMQVAKPQDGEKLYFKNLELLYNPISDERLKECLELENMEFDFSCCKSLFKLTKPEYDYMYDMIREANPHFMKNANEKYDEKKFLNEVFISQDKYNKMISNLKRKRNIIITGGVGVGKTFMAKKLAYAYMGEIDNDRVEFIKFHENYTYEDFVIGKKSTKDGFELEYGTFARFCKKAANHPKQDYFFIIDDIHKANVCNVFGEIETLIELRYRNKKITLANSGISFFVPSNVYIIGTMSMIGKLSQNDYEMQRRFCFFEIEPGFDNNRFKAYQAFLNNDKLNVLIENIKELNKVLYNDDLLGRGYVIGHSYFCDISYVNDEILQDVVEYDIIPLLGQYFGKNKSLLHEWEERLRRLWY